jgi:glycosyltransferase involved in cell wall biosynthesis
MKRPLVSVIVPVNNGQRFLREALESVLAQDYRPLEIIVIDDGSEDGSSEVVRSFEEVRYIRHENRGPGAARNTGIAAARGEFLAFFDADDLMLPHKLKIQVGYLLEHPDVDCVLAQQELLIEPGAAQPGWARPLPGTSPPAPAPPSSAVMRRRVLDRVEGFDTDYRLGEIMEWLGRVRDAGFTIVPLPAVVLRRRIHDGNLSGDAERMQAAVVRGLKARIDRARQAEIRRVESRRQG